MSLESCIICGLVFNCTDYGSERYQEVYGRTLKPICEKCGFKIFRMGKRRLSNE
jgi:hypothetical protein